MTIDTILLFAAGLGTRMRYLSQATPKPLIVVNGQPILHYVFNLVSKYNFKKILINTHYHSEQIENEVRIIQNLYPDLPKITILYEQDLLDTGGTVKNAVSITGTNPIFTMNCDCLFFPHSNIFEEMLSAWNPDSMNFLILAYPTQKAIGYKGKGDFDIDKQNHIIRPRNLVEMPYIYTGLQILKPDIIATTNKKKFSLGVYYLESEGHKIYTYILNGHWCHASSPEDIASIEAFLIEHYPSCL